MDFKTFLETYFPMVFREAWTSYRLQLLADIESAVHSDRWTERPVKSGCGSTSLLTCGAIWAIQFAYSRFVVLIGPSQAGATDLASKVEQRWHHVPDSSIRRLGLKLFDGECVRHSTHAIACVSGQGGYWRGLATTIGGEVCRPDLVLFDNGKPLETPLDYVRFHRATSNALGVFGPNNATRGIVLTSTGELYDAETA